MIKVLLPLAASLLLLVACGGDKEREVGVSSSSDSRASSSSAASTLLGTGVCPVPVDGGLWNSQLVVISAETYRDRLRTLLSVPVSSNYHLAIKPYAGRRLFRQPNRAQRIALASETFYRNAQSLARHYPAVQCEGADALGCAEHFINDFLQPLFQRALTESEKQRYRALFTRAEGSVAHGLHAAQTAALSSPNFIFRTEGISRDE